MKAEHDGRRPRQCTLYSVVEPGILTGFQNVKTVILQQPKPNFHFLPIASHSNPIHVMLHSLLHKFPFVFPFPSFPSPPLFPLLHLPTSAPIDRCINMYKLNIPHSGARHTSVAKHRHTPNKLSDYFNFFFGLNWLVWPHFLFLQLVALGGNLA